MVKCLFWFILTYWYLKRALGRMQIWSAGSPEWGRSEKWLAFSINLFPFPSKRDDSMFLPNYLKLKVLLAQSCPTLCDPMGWSPPGPSVHGIPQARILEWVVIPFSKGSSQPRDQTQVSHIAGRFFTIWATREALDISLDIINLCSPIIGNIFFLRHMIWTGQFRGSGEGVAQQLQHSDF